MNYKVLILGTILIFICAGLGYATIPSQIEKASQQSSELSTTINADSEPLLPKNDHELEEADEMEFEDEVELEEDDAEVYAKEPVVQALPNDKPPAQTPAIPDQTAPQIGYSLAEVAQHKTESSCWTAVDGGVYDLTPFIKKHPGGKANIMKICGIDGTTAFEAQHGGQRRPESTITEFYIGPLI